MDAADYVAFEAAGWVIGSGRCKSAHRQIPHARLKIPGATWTVETANQVLALRVIRANDWWDEYWGHTYGPQAPLDCHRVDHTHLATAKLLLTHVVPALEAQTAIIEQLRQEIAELKRALSCQKSEHVVPVEREISRTRCM